MVDKNERYMISSSQDKTELEEDCINLVLIDNGFFTVEVKPKFNNPVGLNTQNWERSVLCKQLNDSTSLPKDENIDWDTNEKQQQGWKYKVSIEKRETDGNVESDVLSQVADANPQLKLKKD